MSDRSAGAPRTLPRTSPRTCPSARAREGALLLGLVTGEGRIAYMADPPVVDSAFLERARQGRAPEQRFRFASPCAERACDKWNGSSCGVGRTLAALDPSTLGASGAALSCAIAATCRWRAEHGASICLACSYVVTERDSATGE